MTDDEKMKENKHHLCSGPFLFYTPKLILSFTRVNADLSSKGIHCISFHIKKIMHPQFLKSMGLLSLGQIEFLCLEFKVSFVDHYLRV